MNKRIIRRREPLAIDQQALFSGPDAIWWNAPNEVPANERVDGVAVVHIRGALEHHSEAGQDSYDDIIERVEEAFKGGDEGRPDAVVLRIDSPGGVCSGLNETVFALRRMAEESDIPLVAYVDELAASAAYAIACACGEIVMPPSAICGSVGVISTMYDQSQADEEMGVQFVTITSGARKADGHPHMPITDAAVSAEQKRVDKLAKQFFALVSDVRPLSPKEVASYEAGIFLADEAVANGLADIVMSFDELVQTLCATGGVQKKVLANSTNRETRFYTRSETYQLVGRSGEKDKPMSKIALKALVRNAKAAIAEETDPNKKKALETLISAYSAEMTAYKKEKHTIEKHETEEGDEADDADEDEESEAKGNETDRKEGSDDDGDDDDSDDDEGDDEKKSASALLALAQKSTGKKGKAAVGALSALIAQGARAAAEVDQIRKERRAEKKANLIGEALSARAITKFEARELSSKGNSFVESFIDMRRDKKTGKLKAIVNVDDDSVRIPDPNAKPAADGGLSPEILASIDHAVRNAPDGSNREELHKKMIAAHQERMTAALNGAGRY